jgi:membrane protein YdbS with pleckstrin-like domain
MAVETSDLKNEQNSSPNKLLISHITIYRSGFVLASYLLILEILFLGIGVGLRLPLVFFTFSLNTTITLNLFSTIANIGLIMIKIFLMIIIITQWLDNYYEIRPGKIIYKSGFLIRREKEFDCIQISKINLTQGVFGRLFNFGTINLFTPITNEWFALTNIPNPHRNLSLVQKTLANKSVEITITDKFVEDD